MKPNSVVRVLETEIRAYDGFQKVDNSFSNKITQYMEIQHRNTLKFTKKLVKSHLIIVSATSIARY